MAILFRVLLVAGATLGLASTSFGQSSEDGAKAMLAKVVAAVRADKAKALRMFNNGDGGFRDGDLFVSCFNVSDGKFVATGNPNSKKYLGIDGRNFRDMNGSPLKLEEIAKKPEGEITIIDVVLPKPGPNSAPVPKQNYATRIGDLICSVGYFYWYNEKE